MDERLLQAKGLCDKEPDEALRLCNEVMNEEMTGVKLDITRGKVPRGRIPVRIGLALTPAAETAIRKKSNDPAAFCISVSSDGVSLAGLSPKGTW